MVTNYEHGKTRKVFPVCFQPIQERADSWYNQNFNLVETKYREDGQN